MTVLAIASSKGGVGKTTSVVFLAYYLAKRAGPGKVAIVDRDPTKNITLTLQKFPSRHPEGVDLYTGPVLPSGYDHIIVDTPPSHEISDYLAGVDLVVVPAPPEAQVLSVLPDYLESIHSLSLVSGVELIAVLPTRVDLRNKDQKKAYPRLVAIVEDSAVKPVLLTPVPERARIGRWDFTTKEYDAVAQEIFTHVSYRSKVKG